MKKYLIDHKLQKNFSTNGLKTAQNYKFNFYKHVSFILFTIIRSFIKRDLKYAVCAHVACR